MSRFMTIAAISLLAASLSGCATIQSAIAPTTASQVTTLADAEQAATLVSEAADAYVTTANPSPAQLAQIQALSNAVHTALTDLETANAAGQSLTFASLNAALAAFNTYEAGIAVPAPTATASAATGN